MTQQLLIINLPTYKLIINENFEATTEEFHKEGIFINSKLDKSIYLQLLKQFHPDVFQGNKDIATQISQVINSAKDGGFNYANSIPGSEQDSIWNLDSDFWRGTETGSDEQKVRGCVDERLYNLYKMPKEEWEYTNRGVDQLTLIREKDWIIVKVEITIRKYEVDRIEEKVLAFRQKFLHHLDEIDLTALTKYDLVEIMATEGITFYPSWNKKRMISAIEKYAKTLTTKDTEYNYLFEPRYAEYIDLHKVLKNRPDLDTHLGFSDKRKERFTKVREEREAKEQANYGKFKGATEWLKGNKKGFVGKNSFRLFVKAAEAIASNLNVQGKNDDSGKYTLFPSEIWLRAFASLSATNLAK